jgi:hypothetical protein
LQKAGKRNGATLVQRPFRNRVQSTGEIVASATRGLLTGNRGRLHDSDGQLTSARWRTRAWVTCSLEYRGWYRPVMGRGYTHLFFLDEAVALAAGHRPCALCRRDAYNEFRRAWQKAFGNIPLADEVDARLHSDRIDTSTMRHRRYATDIAKLPVGTFVQFEGSEWPMMLLRDHVVPCNPGGYGEAESRPRRGQVTVLTPITTVNILEAGFMPRLHPSLDHLC